ncbi:MAG: AAA family ATPase, partial [Myxococcota bacterium]
DVALYLHALVEQTRVHHELTLGASPRATLSLFRACQARAYLQQRSYVSPDDVQFLAAPVLGHRVMLSNQARYSGKDTSSIVEEIVSALRVPT